jgi:hypothetical protein
VEGGGGNGEGERQTAYRRWDASAAPSAVAVTHAPPPLACARILTSSCSHVHTVTHAITRTRTHTQLCLVQRRERREKTRHVSEAVLKGSASSAPPPYPTKYWQMVSFFRLENQGLDSPHAVRAMMCAVRTHTHRTHTHTHTCCGWVGVFVGACAQSSPERWLACALESKRKRDGGICVCVCVCVCVCQYRCMQAHLTAGICRVIRTCTFSLVRFSSL